MYEELKLANWRDVSFTSGRVATEQDVKDGKAVFYIPSGSEPYETELPLFGVHIDS